MYITEKEEINLQITQEVIKVRSIWWLGKYEVIGISKTKDGKNWRIDVGIRRAWPLYLFDHRPWEKIARRHFPVRTFIGRGIAWGEIVEGQYLGAGKHVPILNAIISDYTITTETEIA